MTENKRFKTIVDNKVLDAFFCVPVFEYDEYLGHIAYGDDKIVDRLNEVHEINGRCNREITLNHQKILKLMNENEQLKFLLNNTSDQRDEFHRGARENANRVGKLEKENEQLKQRINSRLHFYRELYESTNDDVVKRVIEDLEDILKK